MRENTKEVEIGGQKYQIGRMDAMSGAWIVMQIVTKLLPFNLAGTMAEMMGKAGQDALNALPQNRNEITEAEFRNIQTHCLRVCARVEMVGSTPTPMPILMANGAWAIKELQTDIITVLALTAQALVFNVAPFFDQGALEPLLESLSGLSQFSAPRT